MLNNKNQFVYLSFLISLSFLSTITAKYYSQIKQDSFLNETFFKNKKNGVFIDIGAHDGVSFSNTYFFEKELGWTGICFEPLTEPFEKLKQCRNSICINACVAKEEGIVDFIEVITPEFEMYSGIFNTYEPQHFNLLNTGIKEKGGEYKITQVPAVNFNKILKQYNLKNIDYISIDTEGSELEIIHSIDFTSFNVYVLSIENNYKNPLIGEWMESQGFQFVTRLEWQDDIYYNPNYFNNFKS